MSMTITVDVKEAPGTKGKLERVRRSLLKAARSHVDVGFFDGRPHPKTGETVATVAAINEFGVAELNIPERPFMAATARSTKVGMRMGQELKHAIANPRLSFKWGQIGDFYAKEIKATIENFSQPGNAPLTISLKGFDNPLVETGYMRDHVMKRVKRTS